MSGRAACTIVAKPWVAHARVLARSFSACHPDVPMFVLLADEAVPPFDAAAEPYATIDIRSLALPGFNELRFRYGQQQLSYAATPFLLAHLLDRGFDRVLFFKQESLVLGSHEAVFRLLDSHDVVLTPHLASPVPGETAVGRELNILLSGAYNAGLLGVAGRTTGRRFVEWWQRRTFTHCLHDVTSGLHWEQRWLDLVPAMFRGVHILRDERFNVGHWNLPDRRVRLDGSRVIVGDEPCSLFRFSGFPPEQPGIVTRHSTRLAPSDLGAAWQVFERFRTLLREAGHEQVSAWPYAWSKFDNNVPIPDLARRVFAALGDDVSRFGDPVVTRGNSFFHWLNEPADGDASPDTTITRLWAAAWRARADVTRAFPDPFGADRRRFVGWTRQSGWRELQVHPAFLPQGVACA